MTNLPELPEGWQWVHVPSGTRVSAHHPDSDRMITIRDGKLFVGYGERTLVHSVPISVILAVLAANNAIPNSGPTPTP